MGKNYKSTVNKKNALSYIKEGLQLFFGFLGYLVIIFIIILLFYMFDGIIQFVSSKADVFTTLGMLSVVVILVTIGVVVRDFFVWLFSDDPEKSYVSFFTIPLIYTPLFTINYAAQVKGNDQYFFLAFVATAIGYAVVFLIMAWLHSKFSKSENKQEMHKQKINSIADSNSNNSEISPEEQFPAKKPRFDFNAVHGMSDLKSTLMDTYDGFKKEGGNGVLLFGEPGNGKTFIAEAFAGRLKMNFLEARTSELTSKWVGESSERITAIFKAAKMQAPCVLFLDEIDSFLLDRGSDMNQDARQSANTLLTAIADLHRDFNKHQVLVMAATNFIDKLDAAGSREGRFDKKIEVYSPDFEARKFILSENLKSKFSIAPNAIDMAVKRWEGFSVARIRQIAKVANTLATKSDGIINVDLLSRALREVQGRIGDKLAENSKSLKELQLTEAQSKELSLIINMMNKRHIMESQGGDIPKGALFIGPPGTGKTTVARALAKELGWAFLATTGTELLHSPNKIDEVIADASNLRPAILFIDEAEGILANREMNPQTRDITNKLLAAIDGEKPLHDVFFVAATNFVDNLDSAMLRWGRFSETIDFTPNRDTINGVVSNFIQSKSEFVDFEGSQEELVERLFEQGWTPADVIGQLTKGLNRALVTAEAEQRPKVQLESIGNV
jgi:transitional endoplasmic reticulum ATPase